MSVFPDLARISILPRISRIWLCLRVQNDLCMTSVAYVFKTLSRYFESKQYRNPGPDASGKNGTYGCNDVRYYRVGYITKSHRVHAR